VDDSLEWSLAKCYTYKDMERAYGNVTQDSQQDVDEEVGIASALQENT
jgi:hypothetical protein